jgi:hypothetical protein
MARLTAGVVESQPQGVQTLFETDWTIGSIPAGWTLMNGTPVYSGTGTYPSNIDDTGIIYEWNIQDGSFTALTIMCSYKVNVWSECDLLFELPGVPGSSLWTRNFPAVPNQFQSYGIGDWGDSVDPLNDGVTGIFVTAATMDATSNWAFYVFEPGGGTPTPITHTDTASGSTFTKLTLSFQEYDFINAAGGTAGDIRLQHTYANIGVELDATAIGNKATSWGWT